MSTEIKRKIRLIPTTNQISEICNNYNIGNLISIIEVIENTANINIKVFTSKGKFVIRISSVDHDRYNFIMKVLTTLDNNNVPVLLPLKNIEGEYISSFGLKVIQVTNFNKGHAFNYSEKQAYSSGRMLRRFHDTLVNTSQEVRPRNSVYPTLSTINKSLKMLKGTECDISKEELALVTSLYEQIIGAWESNCKDLPTTIIHGDWHQGNQLYLDSEEVSCIMDFDFMTRAERLFDVAYALWHFRIYKESLNIGKAFLQGYGTLTNKEIELLPLEIARINYFFICTSAFTLDPKQEFKNQMEHQYPFIKWVLSKNGKLIIKNLCEISDTHY